MAKSEVSPFVKMVLKVSHLFFVDDSLLFCRANDHDCQAILEVLEKYEQALGQRINQDKTRIFFSSNTARSMQENIKGLLGVLAISRKEFGTKYKDGRKAIITNWKRNLNQGCDPSHANFHH